MLFDGSTSPRMNTLERDLDSPLADVAVITVAGRTDIELATRSGSGC